MSDDLAKKLTNIQNQFEGTREDALEALVKLQSINSLDLMGAGGLEMLRNMMEKIYDLKKEEENKVHEHAPETYFEAMSDEEYQTAIFLEEQYKTSHVRDDVADPLADLKCNEQIDDPLNDDSTQHCKDYSSYSLTKDQDGLDVGAFVKVEVKELEEVNSVEISPNISDDDINNTTEQNIKQDLLQKYVTSLPQRSSIDPMVTWKNNRTAEGTSPTNVQELMGSSAGGGEVAVHEVDRTSHAAEDHKRYTAFDKKDYTIRDEVLFCTVCERNVYGINSAHIKSRCHQRRLNKALGSATKHQDVKLTKGWQVTEKGFLHCCLCLTNFAIETRHCRTHAHILSKKYKTCPRIQALKQRALNLLKKLPPTIFDKLLALRLASLKGAPAEANFCVGCDEHFNTRADRTRHECESEQHRGWVDELRRSDPFKYSFGILPKTIGKENYQLQYCVLCKTGMTNSIEIDNHVHGAGSKHLMRVRQFWARVIPGLLQFGLANAFPRPFKDTANYWLDHPKQMELYYSENLLRLIVISTDGYSMCSLCDEYVCGELMKAHCDSNKHTNMRRSFLSSLRSPDRRARGIICKGDVWYCVLCHVGFSNKMEIMLHLHLEEPHSKRVRVVYENFDRYIKSAVSSF